VLSRDQLKQISIFLQGVVDILDKAYDGESTSTQNVLTLLPKEPKKLSDEDVRSACIACNDMSKVREILDAFGVKKISQLSEESYPEVIERLKANV
jgi:hypothetical protein